MQHFAVGRVLGDHLPEDEQQLFDHVVLDGHDKPDDGHQEAGQLLAIQNLLDGLLQGLSLCLNISLF